MAQPALGARYGKQEKDFDDSVRFTCTRVKEW